MHYGQEAENRYDSPTGSYGVLYLGQDLHTALMESVFHKHQWQTDPKRQITLAEIRQRMVRLVATLQNLVLFNISEPDMMAATLGLNLEQLIARDYTHTQQLSQQVHAMTTNARAPRISSPDTALASCRTPLPLFEPPRPLIRAAGR